MLQLNIEFCQQNGPERGQVEDWHLTEKMMVVPGRDNRMCYL